MSTPLVVVLCGSPADGAHCDAITQACATFGLEAVVRVASAHRTPLHALDILRTYEAGYLAGRPTVLITVAGRSNALSGFADPQVSMPVIACPPPGDPVDVWSSLRMPAGVAPVVVLEPANAALAAAKMVGLVSPGVRAAVGAAQAAARQRVQDADEARHPAAGGHSDSDPAPVPEDTP